MTSSSSGGTVCSKWRSDPDPGRPSPGSRLPPCSRGLFVAKAKDFKDTKDRKDIKDKKTVCPNPRSVFYVLDVLVVLGVP